jgi:hypothetical protein
MTMETTRAGNGPLRILQSVAAVVAGFLVVFVLSTGIDLILHATHVFPPEEQGLHSPALNLLALSYRLVATVLGGYVTAWIAPMAKMRHALVLGLLGTVAAIAGCIVMIPMHYGPNWYPISLVITALPCCWLGGRLRLGRG